jgi:hypothetical protein
VELGDESDYQYPFLVLCGEMRLHTDDCHPSEERSRFRSESITISESEGESESDVVLSGATLAGQEVDRDSIDLEISLLSLANNACDVASKDSHDLLPPPPPPAFPRLTSPFVGLDDLPDGNNGSSSGSSSGSSEGGCGRVWQCALLGLPFELIIQVVCEYIYILHA